MKILITTLTLFLSMNILGQTLNKSETIEYIEKKLKETAENEFRIKDDVLYIDNNFSKHTWKIDIQKVNFINGQNSSFKEPTWIVIDCKGGINCMLESGVPKTGTMIILNNKEDVPRLVKAFNHLKDLLSTPSDANKKDPFD